MTPLQMAMVAAAIANGGVVMRPRRRRADRRARTGKTVAKLKPDELGRAVSRDDRRATSRR